MALVLQNDVGTSTGANAYIDFDYFSAYHEERGVTQVINGEYDEDTVDAWIIQATDFMDARWRLRGSKLNGAEQTTAMPRACLYDHEGHLVEGIPTNWKRACAELALKIGQNGVGLMPDPVRDESGRVVLEKTEVVGPITETTIYQGGPAPQLQSYPMVERLVRDYVYRGGGTYR